MKQKNYCKSREFKNRHSDFETIFETLADYRESPTIRCECHVDPDVSRRFAKTLACHSHKSHAVGLANYFSGRILAFLALLIFTRLPFFCLIHSRSVLRHRE